MSFLLLVFTPLMFSSARARFRQSVDEFREALVDHFDLPRVYNLAGRIVLISGEVILLQLAAKSLG